MSDALKARLLGAAVLVGVALLILGALLGGPKERAAPAGNVIIIQPNPEKPPSLTQRPVRPAAEADAEPQLAKVKPEQPVARDEPAEPAARSEPPAPAPTRTEPRVAAQKPPEPARSPTPKPAPTKQPAPKPEPEPAAKPPQDDLYARIAGTAPTQPKPAESNIEPSPPPAAETPKASVPDDGWRVRVASYGDADNAQRMEQRLRDAGFRTRSESVRINGRTYTRVHVGPYATEREAKAAQQTLKAKIGEAGQLIAP